MNAEIDLFEIVQAGVACRAFFLAALNDRNSNAASIAMMAMATSNSTSVKARLKFMAN